MQAHVQSKSPATGLFANIWSWDFACRMVAGSFFVYLLMINVLELTSFVQQQVRASSNFHFYLSIVSKLTITAFIGLHCLLFIIRWRPIEKSRGPMPRVMAMAGSFFFYLIAIPGQESSLPQIIVGLVLVSGGTLLAILALSKLGRSYSIMPEARRLVTTGFYSFVRHPMYLSEAVAIAGIIIQRLSLYSLALFTIHLWIQIQRMKNEEAVLERTFPEYEAYKAKVSRLIPNVY